MSWRSTAPLFAAFFVLCVVPATAQGPTCPFPVPVSLECDNGTGCHQKKIVNSCQGPLSISKCQYSGTSVNCCGQVINNAMEFGACGGNGGPVGASLKELEDAPLFLRSQVVIASCDGGFRPLSKSLVR